MRCPYCGSDDDQVVDSRSARGGDAVRRRRECRACGQRFSTYERVEHLALAVRKRSGVVQPFEPAKVAAGVNKAVKNLDLDPDAVRRALASIEARVRRTGRREVGSDMIGREVLAVLRALHHVAYMRFASVYKGFTTSDDFRRELARLEKSVATEEAGRQR